MKPTIKVFKGPISEKLLTLRVPSFVYDRADALADAILQKDETLAAMGVRVTRADAFRLMLLEGAKVLEKRYKI